MTIEPVHLSILFCGDRDWTDYQAIFDVMTKFQPSLVIQGDAKGADRIAGICADLLGIPQAIFPANWKKYGRAAGPVRNKEMLVHLLKQPGEKMVFAFHDSLSTSKGTANMVKQAKKAGIHCKNIRHSTG